MKYILLLLLTVSSWWAARAADFLVTTNADSGPGSLRTAILQANANGTASPDIIRFNLPITTPAGRTIYLNSSLPTLSSHITIDASTQAGSPLGISTARVTLVAPDVSPFVYLLIDKATHVSIYGLCFRSTGDPTTTDRDHYAIGLKSSSYITIGSATKGNLFSGVRNAITNRFRDHVGDSAIGVTIQGNVFGLHTNNTHSQGGHITLTQAANITIGADDPSYGNVLIGTIVDLTQSPERSHAIFADIRQNRFNLDWTATSYYDLPAAVYLTGNTTDDAATAKTHVVGNHIISTTGGLGLNRLLHKTVITGNLLGIDKTGTTCQSATDISFQNCRDVQLGGHGANEQNTIAGTIYTQRQGIHIIKNRLTDIRMPGYMNGDPYVTITGYTNGNITGQAPPRSTIQLYTNDCQASCAGKNWLASIQTDAAGNWSYPYTAASPNIVATATTADSATSVFSTVEIDETQTVVKHAVCTRPTGTITGISVKQGTHITWTPLNTIQVISTAANLENVAPGTYTLRVTNGLHGCDWQTNYTINDVIPPAGYNAKMEYAYCGQNIGTLWVQPAGYLSYQWTNSRQETIANSHAIADLYPDSYYLKAWVTDDPTCYKTYGPYKVLNVNGPTALPPVSIQPATCGKANGSITGITVTDVQGQLFRQWVNEKGEGMAVTADLANVPPGRYRLKFKDEAICDTAYSPWYAVPNTGAITLDLTAVTTTPAKCSGAGGAITGVQAANATNYQWLDGNNNLVGQRPDVYDLAAGTYQLQATNATGCEATTAFSITTALFAPISVTKIETAGNRCLQQNGFAQPKAFTADSVNYTFRWVAASSAQTVSTTTGLYDQPSDVYFLWASDSNHCAQRIYDFSLTDLPAPVFDYTKAIVTNDACNMGNGSISGLQLIGVYGAPTYVWQDEQGAIAGNSLHLTRAKAGNYTLTVNDPRTCTVVSTPLAITNSNTNLPPPAYDDQVIPRHHDATLQLKGSPTGNYRLYADAAATRLLEENKEGRFILKKLATDTTFYIQQVAGDCTPAISPVKITVIDESHFSIPNAFTPNNDGNNDRLNISITGLIQLNYFRVYSRWGQLVFESRRLSDGWDGNWQQKPQPTGTYIWVAAGTDAMGNPLLQKGSVLLIR